MARRSPSSHAVALDVASQGFVSLTVRGIESLDPPVPTSHLRALLVLERSGPLNLGRLAEGLHLSLSATSRTCDRLVESRLIVRDTAPHSRRELVLTLAPAGRRILHQLHLARQAAFDEVLQQMAPGDVEKLLEGLQSFTAAAGTHLGEAVLDA
ncbi:MAG: transcriptional regulator, MarR family protein [Mycobacterium sp.]|jgi:DNA-binding MarR family transcriptional regulator|nr:transcriptional regulator, MarR family protein [Mycobacterium sp.]